VRGQSNLGDGSNHGPAKGLPGHEKTSADRAERVALGSLAVAAGWRSIMRR